MAYSQQFLCGDNASNADFWSWGTAISTFLGTTLGWTKTDSNVTWGVTSAPGASAYVYEVWTPGTATFQFWMKIEYGTASSNSCPVIRISIASGPSSSGTLSGNIIGPLYIQAGNTTAETAAATFECNFTGDSANRFAMMMWRNAVNNNRPCFVAIERSQSSAGSYSQSYLTIITSGYNSGVVAQQQTLYAPTSGTYTAVQTCWAVPATNLATLYSLNNTPALPVFPLVTVCDAPLQQTMVMKATDGVEGTTVTATVYASHPYISSLRTNFNSCTLGGNNTILMRAD